MQFTHVPLHCPERAPFMQQPYGPVSGEWDLGADADMEQREAECESLLAPHSATLARTHGGSQHQERSLFAAASFHRRIQLTLLLTCFCLILLPWSAISTHTVSLLPRSVLTFAAQHLMLTLSPAQCSLPSSRARSTASDFGADLVALLDQSGLGAVTSRLSMPGEMTTVLSHIAMTSELQLPPNLTLTTLQMLRHDEAVLRAAYSNRLFVHSRQLFSPLSDQRLLLGGTARTGVSDEKGEDLLPLHDACSARRVLPINPSLDSRNAPAYYDYSIAAAIDEACSAGRRPAVEVSWSDNLCHDDSVYVHSLHQRITRASTGNRAGSVTFRVLGVQATHGRTGGVQRFLLLADDLRGDVVDLQPELKGRLVGPAIVAVQRFTLLNVTDNSTQQLVGEVLGAQDGVECAFMAGLPYSFLWLVEYEAFDSGLYMLELRVTWIKRAARWGKSGLVEKRPHALLHTVYRGVLNVVHDYNDAHAADDSSHNSAGMQEQQLCQQSDVKHDVSRGRWLPLPLRLNTTELYCDDAVCSGSNVGYLQDEHGFSIDYGLQWVWRPAGCRLRLFSPASFAQCLHRLNYTDLYIHGDSLAREQFQNLVMLLDVDGVINLPKTQATAEQLIKQADKSDAVNFHLRYDQSSTGADSHPLRVHFIMQDPTLDTPDAADGRRLLLWSPRLATGLYEERDSWHTALNELRKQLALQSRQCRDSRQMCYLFVHPTVQAQHKNIITELWRDQQEKDDYHCDLKRLKQGPTQRSVVEVMDELKMWLHDHQRQQPGNRTRQIEDDGQLFNMSAEEAATLSGAGLGMRILPADAITAARWDSSHDALHYSAMCDLLECHLPAGRGCMQAPPFKCVNESRPHYKRNWNGGVSNMVTMTFVNMLCNG